MLTITVVPRDKEARDTAPAKKIYSYFSSVVPRVGEIIEIKNHPPYEVDRVIHVLENGNASVILEVKDYDNVAEPLITSLPLIEN